MIFSIFEQALMALPLVIGAYLILSLLKLPDFSIESAYLCGAVAASMAEDSSISVILLVTMLGGMSVGLLVTFLNQYYAIPFLLSAIVVNGFCHAASQYCLGRAMVRFQPELILDENELLIIIALTALTGAAIILRSQLGYSLAIYGNNPSFFRHQGISTRYVVMGGVMLGHAYAALSGFLFARSNGFVDLTMQAGIILLCLTALMIGKLALPNNLPNIATPCVGVLAYFCMQQLLLGIGLDLQYFNAFQACAVLALLLTRKRKQTLHVDHLGV